MRIVDGIYPEVSVPNEWLMDETVNPYVCLCENGPVVLNYSSDICTEFHLCEFDHIHNVLWFMCLHMYIYPIIQIIVKI